MTAASDRLAPGSTIGILGGGQLGRMLAMAAAELGFDCVVYEPEADCPAGRVAAKCFNAAWDDQEALAAFAECVDVVTFEFENVPAASLAFLEARAIIRPGLKSLQWTQDRLVEKQFIQGVGLKTAPFAACDSPEDLERAVATIGLPAILKTRTLGYDGKGQFRLSQISDVAEAWSALGGKPAILEGFVPFEREVSVILARAVDGSFAAFDVTENVHQGGILRTSTIPAQISDALGERAVAAAAELAAALDHIGVLAVEFFVLGDELVVNEIAPRVHNSGHWTQDGCAADQFQQHIRAVVHWPLASTKRHAPRVVMTNLIGHDVDALADLAGQADTFVHLYGKRAVRDGRKMGHVIKLHGLG
ncbi:MAG: 5-(carboxyamino)imidazole ribonucleotide synthase [Hyphomonadaceae bacterium]|jgi:5-(carboxyamino)imidazole ribonucleotide synthase